MKKTTYNEAAPFIQPQYEIMTYFEESMPLEYLKLIRVEIAPGARVPAEGFSCHTEDEYSYFVEGELYTESGDFKGICSKGDFSIIPLGEEHWCENRTDKPCVIFVAMAK
ncbi:MAG: cupin domain-containing protein [Eubacteriaceae bacterium]|nr:cupin domain-containing protein [Eubacteriaceae bacterium]